MEIVCFSYNRGRLLRNAILSARFCAPKSKITVFDDLSDDPETLDTLEDLRSRFNIEVIRRKVWRDGFRGGLHRNIKEFVDNYASDEISLLMQDDTQFFRVLSQLDLASINEFFDKKNDAIFLYPLIPRHKFNPSKFTWSKESGTYFRLSGSAYSGYSDVCLVHVPRARQNLGIFAASEEETSKNAEKVAGPIAHMQRPFLVYLPAPYTVRGRNDALVSRSWRKRNTGVYPVSFLTADDVDRLFHGPMVVPCAHGSLDVPSYDKRNGWPAFHLQGAPGWLRTLDRAERRVREIIQQMGARVSAFFLRLKRLE